MWSQSLAPGRRDAHTHPSLVKRTGIDGKLQAVASHCVLLGRAGQTGSRAGSRARTLETEQVAGKSLCFWSWAGLWKNKPDFLYCLIITEKRFTIQPAFASLLAISYYTSWSDITEVGGVIHPDLLDP